MLISKLLRPYRLFVNNGFINDVSAKQNKFQNLYDSFTRIEDVSKVEHAQKILERIGSVDAEVEGLKNTQNQRDLTIKFHWGHNHRFNDNLVVEGRMADRHLNLMSQFHIANGLSDDYFKGKDVIDVGCWTGGTTLLLKALGANRVLALEEVQKYAQTAKELVTDLYGQENVICEGTNLYDLEVEEKYDVAYFPGVIYHLSDPVLGLRRLFNSLKDGGEIFVEAEGINSPEPLCRYQGNRVYHQKPEEDHRLMNRGGWNWFLPSASCLDRWLIEAGFDETKCFYSYATDRVFGYGKRKRYVNITRAGLAVRDVE